MWLTLDSAGDSLNYSSKNVLILAASKLFKLEFTHSTNLGRLSFSNVYSSLTESDSNSFSACITLVPFGDPLAS
jgi:hypothetical protein